METFKKYLFSGIMFFLFFFISFFFHEGKVSALTSVTYQQGVNNYTGVTDLGLSTQNIYYNNGKGTVSLSVPENGLYIIPGASGYETMGLIKFTNLGIPIGSKISSASLTLTFLQWNFTTYNVLGHYIKNSWDQTSSQFGWTMRDNLNSWMVPGIKGDGTDIISGKSFSYLGFTGTGYQTKTVQLDSQVVQDWINNPNSNQGIVLTNSTSIVGRVELSQSAVINYRPLLSITYDYTPDTMPPSAPISLVGNAVLTSQVNLLWNASTDSNSGVVGYRIYRNSIQVGTVNLGTSYQDNGLSANTYYSYTVSAYDAAGNASAQSNVVYIKTLAINPQDISLPVVSLTSPTFGQSVSGTINITASASDNIGVIGVQFKVDGVNIQNEDLVSPYNISLNTGMFVNGTHSITAVARDIAGNQNVSAAINITITNAPDSQAPSTPSGLITSAISYSQINLSWNASTDNVGVSSYKIYRNGVLIGTSITNSYSDLNLSPSTNYSYTVSASDAIGNLSSQSAVVAATTLLALPPSAVPLSSSGNFFGNVQSSGELRVKLYPMENVTSGSNEQVTFGMPFTRSSVRLSELGKIRVLRASDRTEIPAYVELLTPWRDITNSSIDGQFVRVARVQIKYLFSKVYPAFEEVIVEWGKSPRSQNVSTMQPVKDSWHLASSGSFVSSDGVMEPNVYPVFPATYLSQGILGAPVAAFDPSVVEQRDDANWIYKNQMSLQDYLLENRAAKNFFYSTINQDDSLSISPNTFSNYKTEFEPWLYDRASTYYNLYFASGFVTVLREAVRASEFYKSKLYTQGVTPSAAIGIFSLKSPNPAGYTGGNGAMYSYNENLAYSYWLVGDDSMLQSIRDVETAHEKLTESTRWKPNGSGGFTERHTALKLRSNVIAYEVFGDTQYKDNMIREYNDFIWHQNGAGGAIPTTNRVDGALWHTMLEHEGVAKPMLIASPWMSILTIESMLRVYGVSQDVSVADFIRRMGTFLVASTKLNSQHWYMYTGSLYSPDYITAMDGSTDPGEGSQAEHSLEVSTGIAWANYFGTLMGKPDSSVAQRAKDVYTTYKWGVNNWTRPLAPASAGYTAFRVSPPRKFGWQYHPGLSFAFAIAGPGAVVAVPVTPPSDTTAPTTPTSLSATALSSSAINLTWTASTDNTAVTGYKIYRAGTQIGTSVINSYSDTGLGASTAYTYTVSAYDAAGNGSSQSTGVSGTTQTSQVIQTSISNLIGGIITPTGITISWNTNLPTNGQVMYGLTSSYGSQSTIIDNTTKNTTHKLILTSLIPSTLYHFKVLSTNALGNSISSSDFTFTTKPTLVQTNQPAPIINSFTASPTSIVSGSSSTLLFTTTNATSLSINQNIGTVTGNSKSVSPIATTTYTLTAIGVGGTATKSVTISVTPSPAVIPVTTFIDPVIVSFNVSPTPIYPGQLSTLSWVVAGTPTPTISIDNGLGTITGNSISVYPSSTLTYTITASNSLGTVSSQATVLVNPYTSVGGGGVWQPVTVYIPPVGPTTSPVNPGGQVDTPLPVITRTLYRRIASSEVTVLQKFLVSQGLLTSDNVSGYFGPITEQAVQRFQSNFGIVSYGTPDSTGYGVVGAQTRAKINSLLPTISISNPSTPISTNPSIPTGSTYTFTRNLYTHMEGEDVRELQKFLNAHGFVITQTGDGSPGLETTTFGNLTYSALIRYQASAGINPASGFFGPITRERVNR